ncbi:hypothetical protein [uncultured Sneathia sp.]|uniref:coiled-coil domain-containing protein n=1 Tax=uncultured Sneathia sp. TaxID=278067 RepID=UPI00259BEF13|nr:hypothetical protein [uncultured Sneathia sp.]
MKKTILLASLVASMATMAAGTTGSVEFFNKNEHEIKSTTDHKFTVKEIGVKTEVKVKDTGLSFGGTFQGKDIVLPLSKYTSKLNSVNEAGVNSEVEGEKYVVDTFFNNSSVFVKYDLSEMHNVNSYVKATLNPKVEDRNKALDEKARQLSFKAGNVELEGDVSYTFAKDAKFGVNSKTTFPFKGEKDNYGASVVSTHKLYLDAKKLNSFKDIKAGLELQHSYDKDSSKAVKYVGLNAEGTYAGIDKLDLTGKFNFRYQFNGTSKVSDLLTGDDITLASKDYMHSYELDAKYLMMNDKLELTGGAFVQHVYHNALALKSDDLLKNVDLEKPVAEKLQAILDKAKNEIEEYKKAEKKVAEEKAKLDKEESIVNAKKDLAAKKYDLEQKMKVFFANDKVKAETEKLLSNNNSENKLDNLKKLNLDLDYSKEIQDSKEYKSVNAAAKEYENAKKDLENAYTTLANDNKKEHKALKDAIDNSNAKKAAYEAKYTGNSAADDKQAVNDYLDNKDLIKGLDYLKLLADNTNFASAPEHQINYGVKLGAKYTGVENLTLKANGVFGASTHRGLLPMQNYTLGFVKLDAGAKYDYKVTDKFVVSPEFNTTVKFSDITKDNFKSELVLAPKVSAKYTPIDKLDISGEVEVPIKWSGDKAKFGFDNATIKTGVNIKYTW